jgi:hypothetical protein
MFKLIKLALYGLIGYALYEFVRGLTQGESALQGAARGEKRGGGRELNRALEGDEGRAENMTGPARGRTVTTSDPSGESVTHRVGRGVVQR